MVRDRQVIASPRPDFVFQSAGAEIGVILLLFTLGLEYTAGAPTLLANAATRRYWPRPAAGYGERVSELVRLEPGRRRRPRPLLRTLIGDVLRRERQGQRRTLADVAREARVSVPYLSEVERGRKEASSEVLAAVCGALRIELSDLLAEVRRDLVSGDAVPAPVVKLSQARHRTGADTPVRRAGDVVLLAA